MKKTLKILAIPLSILLIIAIYVFCLINNNQKYLDSIIQDIKDNYQVNEEITYFNKYNNYYIFTTIDKVIVLNNEYEEILKENITKIRTIDDNQTLIYKNNKLMFEETYLEKNKLIYKYYDATNGEFIKETIMEKQ